jgi:hypothetical protein
MENSSSSFEAFTRWTVMRAGPAGCVPESCCHICKISLSIHRCHSLYDILLSHRELLGVGDGAESDLRAPCASPGLYRAPFFDSPFLALPGAQGADAVLDLHLPVVGSGAEAAHPQSGATPLHSAAVAPVVPTAPAAHPMAMDLQPDDVLLAPFLPEDEAYMDQVGQVLHTAACFRYQRQTLGDVTADQRVCMFNHS